MRSSEYSSFAEVVGSLPSGLLLEDDNHLILQVNDSFTKMFGIPLPPDQLVGTDCSQSAEQAKYLFENPSGFVQTIHHVRADHQSVTGINFKLVDGRVFECDYFFIKQNENQSFHLWQYRDVTVGYRLADQLEQRENLLLAVNRVATYLIQVDSPPDVATSLAELGKACSVDRVYIFENVSLPGTNEPGLSQRFEWAKELISPQINNPELQNVPYHPNYSRWFNEMSKGRALFGCVDEFPESERDLLLAQQITSLLVVPIFVNDRFWGFVGFDDCKKPRKWLESERYVLFVAARLIGVALERQRLAAVLWENEQRMSFAFESSNLGLWDWNVKTGAVFFDHRWAAMLGYHPSELEPHVRTWERLVHPDDRNDVELALKNHMEGRTAQYVCEHRLKAKDGTWKWILDQGKIVETDSQGAALRLTGTHTDISERKALEQMKSDFVAMVSHQLKTPIAQICAFVDNMLDGLSGPVTSKQVEYLKFMESTGRRGLKLISDLLSVSKLERGVMTADIEQVSILKLVQEALLPFQAKLLERKLSLRVDDLVGPAIQVNADHAKCIEAFSNVLSNAISYTSSGGITVRIEAGPQVVVTISDTGPGISEERLEHIFDKDRILAGAPSAESGAGLGLHIAHQFMRLQGGTLSVVSKLGKGCAFRFVFSRACDAEEVFHENQHVA